MQKQSPGVSRILTMILFVLTCLGLLVFLWTSFGGSVPFAAKGYQFEVEFDQAVQLASQSDVRISGVSVGKVVSVGLDRRTGLARAVIRIDRQYAPRPLDTRAVLRQKSVLGETFVELSPGSPTAPSLPDGGTLPRAQVSPTVQLDQILSTFDPVTRRAFQVWMRQGGLALTGRGQDFNAAFAELYPFATNVDAVLAVLHRDSAATSTLLRDGGQVFSALSQSPTQLQGLVNNSNAVFAATAAQDTALANAIRAFPAFTVATRVTIDRVTAFARTTQPLIDELRPAAVQLSPALQSVAVIAPTLLRVMTDLAPLTAASKAGVPALEHFLTASVPWLTRQTPYLGGLIPVINYINSYRREIAAFFANSAVTTQGTLQNNLQTKLLHYLRISNPVNPETLAPYQSRLETNRGNPYLVPGGYTDLFGGLSVFGGYLCTTNPLPTIGPTISADLAKILQDVYYTSDPSGPPCKAQAPLGQATTSRAQAFPHLQPLP
jgi:phospholipid/cholesterol/gamma-HCH transport system substrate-binding protein